MKDFRSIGLLALCAAVLAGCQSASSEPDSSPRNSSGQCNDGAVQGLVGKQANPELLDQARRESGAAIARILRPGDIVTLEYNAQRLTLSTDDTLVIQRLNCG